MNVLLLVGISGSGKSTWAKKFLENNPDYLCINRDTLRLGLVKDLRGYYQRQDLDKIENIVNELSDTILREAQARKFNVLVDNTNLDIKYINGFLNFPGTEVSFKLFDCRAEIARFRVSVRDKLEVKHTAYIERQAKQYENVKQQILTNFKDRLYAEQ